MMHAPHTERADRCLRQPRCIDGHTSAVAASQTAQSVGLLADRAVDDLVDQTWQKAFRSYEVWHTQQLSA
jgi:hypothetical protein